MAELEFFPKNDGSVFQQETNSTPAGKGNGGTPIFALKMVD